MKVVHCAVTSTKQAKNAIIQAVPELAPHRKLGCAVTNELEIKCWLMGHRYIMNFQFKNNKLKDALLLFCHCRFSCSFHIHVIIMTIKYG